jgi:hypothetical protein
MYAANYLQRSGLKGTVLDAVASGKSCALSSGACVPLAMPGVLRQLPKWLTDDMGALVVVLEIFTTCASLALAIRGGQSTGRDGAQRRCTHCSHAAAI